MPRRMAASLGVSGILERYYTILSVINVRFYPQHPKIATTRPTRQSSGSVLSYHGCIFLTCFISNEESSHEFSRLCLPGRQSFAESSMLIKKPNDIPSSEITAKSSYLSRRAFITGAVAAGAALAGG